MILEVIIFGIFALLAFLLFSLSAKLITDASSTIFGALTRFFPSTYAYGLFAVLITLCAISLWSLITIMPLLCAPFKSFRNWYRSNVIRILLFNLKIAKSLVIGLSISLIFGTLGISSSITIIVGLIAVLYFQSNNVHKALSMAIGFVTPSFLCKALVGCPGITTINGTTVLKTKRLPNWSIGFIKINNFPNFVESGDRLRKIILGAYASEINLGYCVKFDGKFNILFYVGTKGIHNCANKVCENLSVLKRIILSQLPKANVEIISNPDELRSLVSLGENMKIKVRGPILEIFQDNRVLYFSALRILGNPSFDGKNRFSARMENLLEENIQATYMVFVSPVNENSLRYAIVKRDYLRIIKDKCQNGEAFTQRINLDKYPLSKVSVALFLIGDCEKDLKIGIQSVKATIQSEFSSELDKMHAIDVHGLDLLENFNAFRCSSLTGAGTIMTVNDATTFVKLPQANTQNSTETNSFSISAPTVSKTPKYDEKLTLGRITQKGIPSNHVATLPIDLLNRHIVVVGSAGVGKSNFVKHIVLQLVNKCKVNVLVLDSHGKYREIASKLENSRIFNPTKDDLSINILEIPEGVDRNTHIENVLKALHISVEWKPNLQELVKSSLCRLYELNPHPRISDWIAVLKEPSTNESSNLRDSFDFLQSHLERMTLDVYGRIFDRMRTSLSIKDLLNTPSIIELREMNAESQAFFVGATLTMIQDFRGANGPAQNLHLVCLEEAHIFASKVYGATKSYEVISNCPWATILEEMRKYNEGIILVDQKPSTIAKDALANCDSMVVFRLTDEEDRDIVVRSFGHNPDADLGIQLSDYLSRLDIGQSIIQAPVFGEPFEVKTTLVNEKDEPYAYVTKFRTGILRALNIER